MYEMVLPQKQGLLAALGQPLTVLDVRHRMHTLAAGSSTDTQHREHQQQVDAAQLAHAFFAGKGYFITKRYFKLVLCMCSECCVSSSSVNTLVVVY
jgi:hypothetical protein